ncbi:MAG: tRNA (N6-isopentenyl adenosine(37)-C2)-methylthiotransferase MiaB [Planctomycetaceae bacterium]|nr:MAG: tRNA (N6-isopentenyl adenosine(37)-C2)-methylthiotransferase MiaB [Planctomycetaceae bacterium]
MNMLDSELVVAALRKQGYELTGDIADADTVLFNTCSVREHAEHKIYSALGRLKHSKSRRPNQVIGVIGCMAQKDQQKVFQRAPHVDLVVGTGQLAQIPELVEQSRQRREQRLAVSLDRRDATRQAVSDSFQSYDPLRDPEMRPSPFQAFVRIMIGCDKFCTYCVVPLTRGPEQSRPPRDILQEARQLADEGVKEITLLGQTVNSWRQTVDGRQWRLADLLVALHDVPGLERIKFVTNFPRDMSDDLLRAVRDLPRVARYLHVPVQSGCNEVLRRMKRGYSVEEYREMMARIRETVPGCAVSSDFIVGFCGETEESFQRSVELVHEFRFKNSFIFKYSARPGTKADELLKDDVPEDVKRRRNNELLALQNAISEEDNAALIGRDFEILVEGLSKASLKEQADVPLVPRSVASSCDPADEHPQLVGRTRCDRIVVFDGNPRLVGGLVDVHVYDSSTTTLLGTIVTRERQHATSGLLPILT